MDPLTPTEVIDLLRGRTLRSRVALWLHPPELIGREVYEALQLDIDAVDLRAELDAALPAGTRYVHLSGDDLLALLDAAANRPDRGCALVYNLDLLLAAIPRAELLAWWEQMLDALPYRPRALLLAVPQAAHDLLPLPDSLEAWRRASRLAGTFPFSMETPHGSNDTEDFRPLSN